MGLFFTNLTDSHGFVDTMGTFITIDVPGADPGRTTASGINNAGQIVGSFTNATGTHGFLAMRRTKFEIQRVQSDIDRLSKENAELSDEVKALKTDPHKIESIARDELGLAKPNEVIIKVPESRPSAPRP